MARWPTTGNTYPGSHKAYPVLPNAYPGSGISAYPAGTIAPVTSFAAEFPAAYQVLQFEFGLLYGSVPKATAGNTSTTVVSLSGVIAGVPVPVWVTSTNSASIGAGATFSVSYDGGATQAMTGVTPSVGVPVALTGAGDGLSIAFTAGTSVNANSWRATCAGIDDQTGNGYDATQFTIGLQPVVTVGVNGKPGLLFDGADDRLPSTLNLPAPGTTPWCGAMVARRPTTAAGNARMVSSNVDDAALLLTAATSIRLYNGGAFGPTATGLPTNTWGAIDWMFSNSANDRIQTGSGAVASGAGAGNTAPTNMSLVGSAAPANIEVVGIMYAPASGFTPAAFRAAVTAIYGATVNV